MRRFFRNLKPLQQHNPETNTVLNPLQENSDFLTKRGMFDTQERTKHEM